MLQSQIDRYIICTRNYIVGPKMDCFSTGKVSDGEW